MQKLPLAAALLRAVRPRRILRIATANSWTGVLSLALAAIPPAVARADEPAASGPIAAVLQPFVDSHALAGAVTLLANKDAVLDVETVGHADIAAGKPMTPDTIFWIASMSKPITATALMMLVDEGKVRLDDPVEKFLPEFREQWVAVERDGEHALLKRPRPEVTVRRVLSHTSGLPFKSAIEEPTLDMLTLDTRARSYAMTLLDAQPGAKFNYSNAGINTAGRIIEVVSGMPYEDFLQKRLFEPLGMKDTTFWPSSEQLSRLAKTYRPDKSQDGLEEMPIGQLHYPLDDHRRQPMPAGGLFSTAADLGAFCRMILSGGELAGRRYVSEDSVRQMGTNQTGDLPQTYGLGWSTGRDPGGEFNHGGAYNTFMAVDPRNNVALVYLVQHVGFPHGDGGKLMHAFRQAAQRKINERAAKK